MLRFQRFFRITVIFLSCWLVGPLGTSTALPQSSSDHALNFAETVRPFLDENCVFCHNGELKTAGLELDDFDDPGSALELGEIWERVLGKLLRREMPPPGRPRPDSQAMQAVIKWIETQPNRPRQAGPDPGRVTARRLNRAEYDNTVRDLVGVDLRLADDFPADDAGYGFDNIGDVLSLPPILLEKYMAAADKIAAVAIVARPPVKATLEKYLASRAQEGTHLFFPDGSFRITHEFPVAGEYELRIRVVDRRYRPKKGEPPPPLPAAAQMAVVLGGRRIQLFEVEADQYQRGTFDLLVEADAGEQEVSASFLSHGLEGIPPEQDDKDSDKDERKLFVDHFEILGPLKFPPLPLSESHKSIMICGDAEGGYQPECARRILSRLLRRAYRRPVLQEEIESLLRLVELADGEGDSFAQGMQLALRAILVSPHFLFRIERHPDPDNPNILHEVNQHELATRLSYFLWSSMPDDELFRVAEEGGLGNSEMIENQVRRALGHPNAGALVDNFAGQWLQLRNLESVAPDPERFPGFDEELRLAMRRETELFFETVVREDRSIVDFIAGRFTFLNGRLARHYGIEGVEGDEFRRVELDGAQRSGVLTQASVLTVSSYPTRTSPVLRGKWLLDNILGAPPPDPPPGIPDLKEEEVGLSGTLREQMERHRSNPGCAACHVKMDALGFGLENYDAVGAWRTHDGEFPIDSSGTLPGGKSFSRPHELRAILEGEKGEFARCLTEKMLTYALGRGLESYDKPTVEGIVQRLENDGYRFSRLVVEIANSMPFRMRRGEGEKQ